MMNRVIWAKERAIAAARYLRDRHHVLSSVRHISGPASLSLSGDEVVAVCIGNNAAYYLPAFFDWHRRLGITRFLYIDNRSTDDSVDIACAQPDTIVVSCAASFRLYEKFLRSDVTRMHVKSGWCAMLDTDELLDYEHCESTPLPRFLAQENERGFTAVVAQMLDLFPSYDLREAEGKPYQDCIRDFTYFDLRSIDRHDYFTVFGGILRDNTISNPATCFLFGGIRNTVFGEYCALTKHPLIRIERSKRPFIFPHYSNGVACSDRSILLRHYKFAGSVIERDQFRAANQIMPDGGSEIRSGVFQSGDAIVLHSEHAHAFAGPRELVEGGFLFC